VLSSPGLERKDFRERHCLPWAQEVPSSNLGAPTNLCFCFPSLIDHCIFASSGSLTGHVDFNEFATGKQFFDVPLSGNLALNGDGTLANTFTTSLQGNAAPFHFTAYVVDQNSIYLVGVDNDRVIAGPLARQP